MTRSNQDNEDEVYEDLPDFHLDETLGKLEEENTTLQKRLEELEDVIVDLNNEIKSLHLEKAALKSENATLSTNISSLYKTAVAEVNRKDRIINELRKENYAFLQNQQPKAPQKNGVQASSSRSKAQDLESRSTSKRQDSHYSSRNRENNNRPQGSVRRRSRSAERRRSRSRSPNRSHQKDDFSPPRHPNNLAKFDPKRPSQEEKNAEAYPSKPAMKAKEVPSVDPKIPSSSTKTNGKLAPSSKPTNKTYNKNIVIVDKSVPNTIYTKRLRKRILDEMKRENEALTESPAEISSVVDSSMSVIDSTNSPATIGSQVNPCQNHLPPSSKVSLSKAFCEEKLSPEDKQENQASIKTSKKLPSPHPKPSIDSSAALGKSRSETTLEQVSLATDVIVKVGHCNNKTNEFKPQSSSKELQCPDILKGNVMTEPSSSKNISSNLSINSTNNSTNITSTLNQINEAKPSSSSKKQQCSDILKANVVTEPSSSKNIASNLSINSNKEKEVVSAFSAINSNSNGNLGSASPAGVVLQSSVSNSGSSLLSSLSSGHQFKKFKKDGKTRITPIYIGPRILTQKGKTEKRNTSLVRPVTSFYSSLNNRKSPKVTEASSKAAAEDTETETKVEPTFENKIFSLFGETPEKCQPFISSNSVCSDSSLTNFSFLSSSGSPKPDPKNFCTSIPNVSHENIRTPTIPFKDEVKRTPGENQLSESLQSREEEMVSLFGYVSSDSSDEEESCRLGSGKTGKIPLTSRVPEPISTKNSSLQMQPKAEIIQSYLPKTSPTPDANQNTLKTSQKTVPNIANPSLEAKSFDLSRICDSITPFKTLSDSSSLLFTPAKEALSPIPPTPMGAAERQDSVTQDKSSSSSAEKPAADPKIRPNGSALSSTSLSMQPKAEIIKNYLPKSTSTPFVNHRPVENSSKPTEQSTNSSIESRSFDLSKLPAMHTPFKNCEASPQVCTPAFAMLSPIPPTPQGGRQKPQAAGKSESSELFKIIKPSTSKDQPVLIRANDCEGAQSVGKAKSTKPSTFEDGSSNLSVSMCLEKKVFLSPNSVSAAICCTPFKTFSSDSLQSFMHTPARELLSPIPKTPLGSWEIDDKTNSCDVGLENNQCKSAGQNRQPAGVSLAKEGNNLLLSADKYLVTQIKKSDVKINGSPKQFASSEKQSSSISALPVIVVNETSSGKNSVSKSGKPDTEVNSLDEPKTASKMVLDSSTTNGKNKPLAALEKFTALPCNKVDPKAGCEVDNFSRKAFVPSPPFAERIIPTSADDIAQKEHICKDTAPEQKDKEARSEEVTPQASSTNRKAEESQTSVSHSKSEISVELSGSLESVTEISLTKRLEVVSPVASSPALPKVSPGLSSTCTSNISVSSVSEQMPRQWSSRKVRKVIMPSAQSSGRNVCDDSPISHLKSSPHPGVGPTDSRVFRTPSASGTSLQDNARRNINCESSSTNPFKVSDRRPTLCNKTSSQSSTKGRRAVLIPTDVANNIVKNLQKKSRTRNEYPGAKRSRSPDSRQENPKKLKSGRNHDQKSRFKAPKNDSPGPEPNQRYQNRNSRSSHRKSIDRSSRDYARYRYPPLSHRFHDRRSRSVSRQRLCRRSVSRNLGSDYLARTQMRKRSKDPRPKRTSSSIESSPPSTSSESKKENRSTYAQKPYLKPKKMGSNSELVKGKTPRGNSHLKLKVESEDLQKVACGKSPLKQKVQSVKSPLKQRVKSVKSPLKQKVLTTAQTRERERTASINSSLSSVSTFSDVPGRSEPITFSAWKISRIDLPVEQGRYDAVFRSVADKGIFNPLDPRFQAFLRRSDSSSVEEKDLQGPRAASTPKVIKRRMKDVKLGDSTQVFSPIKPTNLAVQALDQSKPK